jgi:hypothetical protein
MIESGKPAEVEPGAVESIQPLRLQPEVHPSDVETYQLADLLGYHDSAFVTNSYLAIAKRKPAGAELVNALEGLRSGCSSKIQIIEALAAAHPQIRIEGLPSPLQRGMSRWPIVGYVLRLLRAFARLPVVLQHQQQFETYVMAQQQLIADYLNERIVTVLNAKQEAMVSLTELSATFADTVNSVMMFSEALVDISAQQEAMQVHVQKLQTQQEQSETRLHADLMALTEALSVLQGQLDALRRAHDATVAAQREFLIQEQRVIVETQRVAIGDLREELSGLFREQEAKRSELLADVHQLKSLIEIVTSADGGPIASSKLDRK